MAEPGHEVSSGSASLESRGSNNLWTSEFLCDINSAVDGFQAELHPGARTCDCAGLSAGVAVLSHLSPPWFQDNGSSGSYLNGSVLWRYDRQRLPALFE